MGNLGPTEIILILLAIMLLFGYKKLPDASRSLGRSLRIFKGEMKGMKDDDVTTKDAAKTTPVRGQIVSPAQPVVTTDFEAEAAAAEARAAEAGAAAARARADAARPSTPVDGTR